MVNISGYELSTNSQNFTQKDLAEVKRFQKVLGGYFFETPCRAKYYENKTWMGNQVKTSLGGAFLDISINKCCMWKLNV